MLLEGSSSLVHGLRQLLDCLTYTLSLYSMRMSTMHAPCSQLFNVILAAGLEDAVSIVVSVRSLLLLGVPSDSKGLWDLKDSKDSKFYLSAEGFLLQFLPECVLPQQKGRLHCTTVLLCSWLASVTRTS